MKDAVLGEMARRLNWSEGRRGEEEQRIYAWMRKATTFEEMEGKPHE